MSFADTVFINGKIATVDRNFSFKRAVAVKNGWIIDVGEDDEIKKHIGHQTQVIDLEGKLLLPAAHDSHVHIGWLADSWHCVNCIGARSLDDLRALLEERAKTLQPGEWLRAGGLNSALIAECVAESREVNRWDIDPATGDHPTVIDLWDGHSCLLNSKGLELSGVTKETPDPEGGHISKNADGELDGNFVDIPAAHLATLNVPKLSVEELKENFLTAQKFMNSEGYASYTDGATGPGEDTKGSASAGSRSFQAYKELLDEGKLTARVSLAFYSADKGTQNYTTLKKDLDTFQFPAFTDRNWFDCHTVKLFCDGVQMSHTAWMNQDYADRPGFRGRSVFCGADATEEEQISELHRMIRLAHEKGYQVAVHTVGDRATKVTIDGFVKAIQECPGSSRRHYVLHGSMADREDYVKAAKNNILLSEQPAPAGNAYNYEYCMKFVGAKGAVIKGLKDIMNLGVTVAGGSDGIANFVNWRKMVQAAVTRKSLSSGKVFHPELAITVEDGVRMYTINAAYQEFKETIRGSVEVGKVADFQVLDRDIFEIPHDEIGESQVVMTMVDGKLVYQK